MKEPKFAMIYPFLPNHIERILHGKDVICKYVGRGIPRLEVGSKVLFYESGGTFRLKGEAMIRQIEFLAPEDIVSMHGNRLFISTKELEVYRANRPKERKLLVLSLTHVKRFPKPIELAKYVTMAGQTLDKERYEELVRGL